MIGLCLKYEQVNYGSKLQALATIRLMEELGQKFEIIHYEKAGLWFKIKSIPRILNSTFRQDKLETLSRNLAYKKHPELLPQLLQRKKMFQEYDSKNFDKYEIRGKYFKDIKNIAKKYDAVVTCSDQLWSPAGLRTNFYNLMFVPESVRKVSFASSFGVSNIPWYQKRATKRYLDRIEYISCRENRAAEIVKELTGRDVPVLMDPVFAFNKEQWEKVIPNDFKIKGPYIFCYFLGANISYRKIVKEFADSKGLKIVFLRYLDQFVEYDMNFGDIAPFDVNPYQFLRIIQGAEYVFTDSFHGCAFSIILHKKFVVFNRYAEGTCSSKNSRIDTVCDNLGLNNRRVNISSDINSTMNKSIDWKEIDIRLEKYSSLMRMYLVEALNN